MAAHGCPVGGLHYTSPCRDGPAQHSPQPGGSQACCVLLHGVNWRPMLLSPCTNKRLESLCGCRGPLLHSLGGCVPLGRTQQDVTKGALGGGSCARTAPLVWVSPSHPGPTQCLRGGGGQDPPAVSSFPALDSHPFMGPRKLPVPPGSLRDTQEARAWGLRGSEARPVWTSQWSSLSPGLNRACTRSEAASPTPLPRVPLRPEARAAARSLYLGSAAMLVCLEMPRTASSVGLCAEEPVARTLLSCAGVAGGAP